MKEKGGPREPVELIHCTEHYKSRRSRSTSRSRSRRRDKNMSNSKRMQEEKHAGADQEQKIKEQEQEQEDAGREARWGRSGAVDKGEGARTRGCRKRSTLGQIRSSR